MHGEPPPHALNMQGWICLQYLHQQVYDVSVSGLFDLVDFTYQLQPTIHYAYDLHEFAIDFGWFPTRLEHTQCEVLQLVLDAVDLAVGLQLLPVQSTPSILVGVCPASVAKCFPQHIAQHIGCNPQAHDISHAQRCMLNSEAWTFEQWAQFIATVGQLS